MLETDAEDLLKRLSAALEDAGVSWLVREVSAAVQEGRAQETVKVTRPRGRRPLHPAQDEEPERRHTGEYTRSLPYSSQEQLALLLGAISGVFTDSASFNEVLVKEFKNVTFQSEGRFAEEPSFVIDDAAVASHRQAQERVAKLIAKLNEDAES
jgi:hypothetical protein